MSCKSMDTNVGEGKRKESVGILPVLYRSARMISFQWSGRPSLSRHLAIEGLCCQHTENGGRGTHQCPRSEPLPSFRRPRWNAWQIRHRWSTLIPD